jgi:hypothetical protein
MWSVVSISEGGSAKGVGERSRSLGRILARRRDFCRPRAGEPRTSNALSPAAAGEELIERGRPHSADRVGGDDRHGGRAGILVGVEV